MIATEISNKIEKELQNLKIEVASTDKERPWGGYYVIHQNAVKIFIQHFFPEIDISTLGNGTVSPKILVVAPHQKLSWQYHLRREEIWKLIDGEAGLVRSETDEPSLILPLQKNKIIFLKKEERHRLVGFENWGIIAEIWKHTDPLHPSNEEDIIRVEDNYGRK